MYDVAIIGAGMAGASLAAHLPDRMKVLILEAEDQPGYHTTGRSAAFYTETYGGPDVQPLTTASKAWFFNTKAHGSDALMVQKRGALHFARVGEAEALDKLHADLAPLSPSLRPISAQDCVSLCSVLRPDGLVGGLYDPDCSDIDVAAVHSHFLRQAKETGAQLWCRADVSALKRSRNGWTITLSNGQVGEARVLVNAAGAWAGSIGSLAGARAIAFQPLRRTIGVFTPAGAATIDPGWPLVLSAEESLYFKPESGGLLISPEDETPSEACDAAPEEEDLALAAHRFEQVTTLTLKSLKAKWAGLRTFAPDRAPVIGFDPDLPDFFWCAGQGGFGIQTAPAAGAFGAALLTDTELPSVLTDVGVSRSRYTPARFSQQAA